MPVLIDKFYFMILYLLCKIILGPLLAELGNFFNNGYILFLSLFAPLPAILYLSSFSILFKDRGIIYYLLRSFTVIIEDIYIFYNIIFSKSSYSGFSDICFSPISIRKSVYFYISFCIITFIGQFLYVLQTQKKNYRSNKGNNSIQKLFFPKIIIIKKLIKKYRNKNN